MRASTPAPVPVVRIAASALLCAGALVILALPAGAQTPAIPERPEKLVFKPLSFEPPRARDHRVVLKNGLVVYIAEDRALPLVNLSLTLRVGRWLEPSGKEGLAALTGSLLRRGGTKRLTAEQLDERFDFLAAQASSGISDTAGSAGLNCLRDNLDESLTLFVEMLKEPRFQEDRLALAKEQALQEMKKRNDEAAAIESREWGVLLYGEGHFTNRFTHRSVRAGDHPGRPRGLPPPVVPPGEHGGRGLRLVHARGDGGPAREGVRGLAHAPARGPARARNHRARRPRPLPRARRT